MKGTAISLVFAAVLLSGCGYHVSGHADTLPKTVKTIAIPPVANLTTRYKLSDRLAATLTREFGTRTRYKVVADPNQGDATLTAAVISYGC
jgi:outer membrane lipopolysaccharide assembly protein LptE/RlpB